MGNPAGKGEDWPPALTNTLYQKLGLAQNIVLPSAFMQHFST